MFFTFFHGSGLAKSQQLPLVDSFRSKTNLNVTEVRDPDFSMLFPGMSNFTVGILIDIFMFDILDARWTSK